MIENKIIVVEFFDTLDTRYNDRFIIICYAKHKTVPLFTEKIVIACSLDLSIHGAYNLLKTLCATEFHKEFDRWEDLSLVTRLTLFAKKIILTSTSKFDRYATDLFAWTPKYIK